MNKKVITIGVMALLVVGLVTAGLVGYISNTVTTDVTVSSPMEQLNSYEGDEWTLNDLSFSAFGGETETFWVSTKNLANVGITGDVNNFVTNPTGVTCGDFVSVEVTTTTDGGSPDGPYDLIALGLCSVIDVDTIQFSYGPTPITWDAGQVDINEIVVTFQTDADGTYTFTSTIVPETE